VILSISRFLAETLNKKFYITQNLVGVAEVLICACAHKLGNWTVYSENGFQFVLRSVENFYAISRPIDIMRS